MNKIISFTQASAVFTVLVLSSMITQAGAFELKLESSGGTAFVVGDNSALDSEPTVGVISYNGSIDDSNEAKLTLNAVTATGNSAGTLMMSLTDTDYQSASGSTTMTSSVGGTTDGTSQFQSYLDTNNTEYGTSAIACTPGLQGPFDAGAFDDTKSVSCDVDDAFSITIVATANLGAGSVQSFNSSVSVNLLDEPLACRFTGGGVDTDFNWDHTLESGEMIKNGAGNLPAGIDRYQFGGQVGARTASQPQPSGEWQHHQQMGPSGSFSFHGGTSSAADGTRIVDVRCSDSGFCFPARPAPAKQLDFDGIGTFSNLGKGKSAPVFDVSNPNVIPEPSGKKDKPFTFHWFEVNIDDLGEPGKLNNGSPNSAICPGRGFGEKSAGPFTPDPVSDPGTVVILPETELANCDCPDFYRITIYKGVLSTEVSYLDDGRINPETLNKSTVIYESYGYIDGGNLQIHPPTGFDTK